MTCVSCGEHSLVLIVRRNKHRDAPIFVKRLYRVSGRCKGRCNAPGKRVGTHTLRHSYARHLLMNGIPINYLSRWLGHSSIQTTLIYLELVPDPTGSLASVP